MKIKDMVEEFRLLAKQEKDPDRSADLIDEEYVEWAKASAPRFDYKPEDELKELADLVYVCYGYANARGWDLDTAIANVHENNVGRMTQDDGTIQYRDDGKVLKNLNYPKVNLRNLV